MLVGHNGTIVLLPYTFLCNSAADNNLTLGIWAVGECRIFMSSHLMYASIKKQYTLKQQVFRWVFLSYINIDDNNLKHLSGEANSIKHYPAWSFKLEVWGSPLEERIGERFLCRYEFVCECSGTTLHLHTPRVMLKFPWGKSSHMNLQELPPAKGGSEKKDVHILCRTKMSCNLVWRGPAAQDCICY